jgi:phospholipase C
MDFDRRGVMFGGAAAAALLPAIARAAAIDADARTGTIADVEHVVILMQENRAFDHYFGALNGVRGFADRFPIPVSADATVWTQGDKPGSAPLSPFPLNTRETFAHMRIEGTPHNWSDAQTAWDEGRISGWPASKSARSMGYYRREDIPFQYALADAFTVCDAYHASFQGGTNTNRLFLWTGTNDPAGEAGGPSISNSHDSLVAAGGHPDGYRWTTYVERLEAAGVSWRIYQDMADNFSDNPTAGFKRFRDSLAGAPGADPRLAALALHTRALDGLRDDVLAGSLPQVSYIVAPARDSEHPGPSSPAQGADYTARVLDAVTANPKTWSRTVLLVMYDENDGFFDHIPPPAPPSLKDGVEQGGSTVDTTGEYHRVRAPSEHAAERDDLMGRPYGLGPRVPMLAISPWSRGGWVDSEVFDHTSVIRFLERRFGVMEPNISPWRRAVCGDLTSAFDFRTPNNRTFVAALPATATTAARAAALPGRVAAAPPLLASAPVQENGVRRSRPLPYALDVAESIDAGTARLVLRNDGSAGAVFHVYDRRHLDLAPRRYTVEGGRRLNGVWDGADYDLWVLGPNGFHRRFVGRGAPAAAVRVRLDRRSGSFVLEARAAGPRPARLRVTPVVYADAHRGWTTHLPAGGLSSRRWDLTKTGGWYDFEVTLDGDDHFSRRFAGRLETGRNSTSDPAMHGTADMGPFRLA